MEWNVIEHLLMQALMRVYVAVADTRYKEVSTYVGYVLVLFGVCRIPMLIIAK